MRPPGKILPHVSVEIIFLLDAETSFNDLQPLHKDIIGTLKLDTKTLLLSNDRQPHAQQRILMRPESPRPS